MNLYYFASPATFYRLAGRLAPVFFAIALVLGVAGMYMGFVVAPTDAQQGEVYRVIFIHVPAAWMSMFIYFVMACYGAVALTFNARLTSELVLLFLYFGFIALANAFEDPRRGDRASALLALIGLVNLPIIYFSVHWWNTLHQGSSVNFKGTSMHIAMLWSMLLMTFSFWFYAAGAALVRVRTIILERERRTQWVRSLAA